MELTVPKIRSIIRDYYTSAQTLLVSILAQNPSELVVNEQRVVGRKTGGDITGLTAAEVKTLLAIDHGADLAGLGDDDHTQYMLNTVAGANSMLYSVSDNTPAALAVAASRIVGRKSTGDIIALTGAEALAIVGAVSDTAYAASWNGVTTIAPSKNAVYDKIQTLGGGASITSGNYTGNNSVNRAITHGLSATPKFVYLIIDNPSTYALSTAMIISGIAKIHTMHSDTARLSVTAMNGTNFYVGNATNFEQSFNANTRNIYWVAIG